MMIRIHVLNDCQMKKVVHRDTMIGMTSTRKKTKINAHEKKEMNTEVKSKEQEDNANEYVQKESDPNTEDNIEDKNKGIDCTRKPNDGYNNEVPTMNNNVTIFADDETPIKLFPIDDPNCEKYIDNMRLRAYHKETIIKMQRCWSRSFLEKKYVIKTLR